MTTALALKHRPRRFEDLAGQPGVSVVLAAMVAKNAVPHVLLFHGTRGSGKTSAARILAAALNCTVIEPSAVPCGTCDSCQSIRAGGSVDVLEIDAASNGTVEQMRHICDLVTYDVGATCRVVVLDEAHGLSRPAFDVLLKTLEEPPPRVVFVLVTTEPGRVPGTIVSRCVSFAFRRIGPARIAERLAKIRAEEGLSASDELLAEIADRADGGLRDAVMLLDQCARAGVDDIAGFERMTGITDFAPVLIKAMTAGDYGMLYQVVDGLMNEVGDPSLITSRTITCMREVLVLRSGGSIARQGTALRARQELGRIIPAERAVAAMTVLWDLQKVRGIDPRSALDLAAVMCAEKLRPSAAPYSPANGNGHRPATMDEIIAIGGGPVIPAGGDRFA